MNPATDPPGEPPIPESSMAAPPKTAVLVQYSRRRHICGFLKPRPPPITAVFSRKCHKSTTSVPAVPDSSIPRKTRDLPNTSECHACGFRIDPACGKDRLETLYSEWRIVLLCGKCISRVESSAICSYCFAEVSEGFRCSGCNRSIHKSCFLDYKSTAPWSYSCYRSEFSVCVDCWVPKSLAKTRALKRKRSKGRDVVCALGCDSVNEAVDIVKSLEDAVKGASFLRDSKNEGCAESSDKAVKENVLRMSNSPGGKKNETSARARTETVVGDKVIDDAELAFRLHRSMNSSPRISKKFCLDKPRMSIMVYSRMPKRTGNMLFSTSEPANASNNEGMEGFIDERSHENSDKGSSENFPTACYDSSVNAHLAEVNRVFDQGSSQEDSARVMKCNEEDENLHVPMKEGEESSSNVKGTQSQTCSKYDDSVKLMDVGSTSRNDQNLITYCKKRLRLNKGDRCRNLYERIVLENRLHPL